jgi:hypothetical protein
VKGQKLLGLKDDPGGNLAGGNPLENRHAREKLTS